MVSGQARQLHFDQDFSKQSYLLYPKIPIMNKNILLLGLLLCTAFFAAGQKDYRVVFDMTSKDSIHMYQRMMTGQVC